MNIYFQCFRAKLFQTQVSFERYLNSQSSQTPSTLSYNSIKFYVCKTFKNKGNKKKTKTMTNNLIFHCNIFESAKFSSNQIQTDKLNLARITSTKKVNFPPSFLAILHPSKHQMNFSLQFTKTGQKNLSVKKLKRKHFGNRVQELSLELWANGEELFSHPPVRLFKYFTATIVPKQFYK